MILELLILLEIIAFILLILGVLPYKRTESLDDPGMDKNPLLNKLIFIFLAMILFFSLGVLTLQYQYNYCYINSTISDYSLNKTTSTATCGSYDISSPDLSSINYGAAILCLLLSLIIMLLMGLEQKDKKRI